MNLRSFGCSFTAGTDLFGVDNVWSNLIAERLGTIHLNHGQAGIGNLRIAELAMLHSQPGDVCVVNWTWIDRFDFIDVVSEDWKTILPVDVNNYAKTYYRYLHSQYRDMLSSLMLATSLIDYFERNGIRFMMTIIDDLWFESVEESWHNPRAIKHLQNRLKPYVHYFEGQNFLAWSKTKGFPISATSHPLDPAHEAAADLMQPIIESILHKA